MSESVRAKPGEAPLLIDRAGMPCELDEGIGYRCKIGLIVLATDQTIEHEFRRVVAGLDGIAVYYSRIYNSATITKQTLAEMEQGIAEATRVIVPNIDLDVVAYGCTSGAMVIGRDNVHARIHEARPEVACTTPLEATCAAFRTLDVRRIAFIPPYSDDINRSLRDTIVAQGFDVPVMGSWNLTDDDEIARVSPLSVRRAVLELGAANEVDGVFVSCTNVRLVSAAEELEQELGKPVTSSSHATAWHCLRLAGYDDAILGFGELFRRRLV